MGLAKRPRKGALISEMENIWGHWIIEFVRTQLNLKFCKFLLDYSSVQPLKNCSSRHNQLLETLSVTTS